MGDRISIGCTIGYFIVTCLINMIMLTASKSERMLMSFKGPKR